MSVRRALTALAFLLLPAALSAQEPDSRPAPSTSQLRYEKAYTVVDGDELEMILRDVRFQTRGFVISAQRGVLFVGAEEYVDAMMSLREEAAKALEPGPESPSVSSRDLRAEAEKRMDAASLADGPALQIPELPLQRALRALYVEGDVEVRDELGHTASCDSLLFDASAGRLLLIGAEARMYPRAGESRKPLSLRAKVLRQELPGVVHAHDAFFTSCELAVPHYHARATDLRIVSVSNSEALIDARENELQIEGLPAVPLPDLSVYSTDLKYFPLEAVAVGRSRRDGEFVRTRWGHDFREIGDEVNRSLGIDGNFKGHWSLDFDVLAARGIGFGPTLTYETPGAYRGETTGYFLSDRGANQGFLSDVYRETSADRGRIHTINRVQLGSKQTWLDVELSHSSDPLLRPEFFPVELKREKEFENVLYFRSAKDSLSMTGLLKSQIDPFEPIVETGISPGGTPPSQTNALPFLDARFYSAPIAELPLPGGTSSRAGSMPLLYSARVDAGYLERHFSEAELRPQLGVTQVNPLDQRAWRFDTVHNFSTPFKAQVANVVPFFEVRQTSASATAAPGSTPFAPGTSEEDASRLLASAGARAGSHLEGELGSIRHVMDFTVDYRNTFESSEPGTKFIPFDEVDPLDRTERFLLEMRHRLGSIASEDLRQATFADVRVAVPYFPNPNRDNGGDTLGDLRTDARLDLGRDFTVPGLRIRSRALTDPYEFKTRKSDHVITANPFGSELDVSVAYREARPFYDAVAIGASYLIGDKWAIDALEQFDLRNDKALEQRLSLRRYGHDWVFELSFSFDTNDNSQSISFTIFPTFGAPTRPRDRYILPEPTFRGFY